MFETEELRKDIAHSRDALLNAIVQSKDRAALGKAAPTRSADWLALLATR